MGDSAARARDVGEVLLGVGGLALGIGFVIALIAGLVMLERPFNWAIERGGWFSLGLLVATTLLYIGVGTTPVTVIAGVATIIVFVFWQIHVVDS